MFHYLPSLLPVDLVFTDFTHCEVQTTCFYQYWAKYLYFQVDSCSFKFIMHWSISLFSRNKNVDQTQLVWVSFIIHKTSISGLLQFTLYINNIYFPLQCPCLCRWVEPSALLQTRPSPGYSWLFVTSRLITVLI